MSVTEQKYIYGTKEYFGWVEEELNKPRKPIEIIGSQEFFDNLDKAISEWCNEDKQI